MNNNNYDVIVIGAGHAGLEAAFACSKRNLKTAIITLNEDNIGKMPCNPSIGGPAKGVVTREIGALGGMQALAADETQIQIKMLGTSKGPGVWALRAQIDKIEYHKWFLEKIKNQTNLDLIIDEVTDILIENNKIIGVALGEKIINCKSLIITSGTYLQSKTFKGDDIKDEGPDGSKFSKSLSGKLLKLGFNLIRLKTGTPPRIKKDSIDYTNMEIDYGSEKPLYFDEYHLNKKLLNVVEPCYLFHSNLTTHQIVNDNIQLSPMYSDRIKGVGPRYCPSFEDKIMKFNHRERHQIFIEPESLQLDTIYLGGFSTSMPIDVQEKMIRSLSGFKDCIISKYGYAIEYDAIDPTELFPTLMTKKIEGLFLAGQINGTSGYEEAAGQGLIAGINAANFVEKKEMLVLNRSNSYIGVMIDDIVTKGVTEPYRLLTSRAEHRLFLRDDNAYERLAQIGYEQGLVSDEQYNLFIKKQNLCNELIEYLKNTTIGQIKELNNNIVKNNISLFDFLKRPEIHLDDFLEYIPFNRKDELDSKLKEKIEINIKFSGYIKIQEEKIEQLKKIKDYSLSKIDDYSKVANLSLEAIDKLNKIKPLTLLQASRISGINLEDIVKIKYHLDINNND